MHVIKKIIFLLSFLFVFYSTDVHAQQRIDASTIYEVLLTLPIAKDDINDPRKQDQLYPIATAIERAVPKTKWPENDKVGLVSYFVAIGYKESRFALKVHHGVPRAHSYGIWQVTPWAYKVKRIDLIGLSQTETDHTAEIVGRAISTSWNCGSSPADHFTAYYGGVPCNSDWPTLKERVRLFWYVRGTLVKFQNDRDSQK